MKQLTETNTQLKAAIDKYSLENAEQSQKIIGLERAQQQLLEKNSDLLRRY